MIRQPSSRPVSGNVISASSKENVGRNTITSSATATASRHTPSTANPNIGQHLRTQYAPSNAPATVPVENQYIEHHKRDSRGGYITKRYLKGALLGKGGFAKCYKLVDQDTNEEWACKVVQKSSLTKQRHKAKLQTEIKIHKALSHKHVVRFEEVFEDRDNVYIIMELCTQQTMLELVKRKKRLTESETRKFMLQMLEGVKYMHSSKVIHRDLKLGNLFLGRGDEIKIGDFGLACKLAFDGERKRTLCGTPNYIAPEVLEGKNGHSYEVDTWSIGVVLYTCLVGKPPFETSDVKSTYKLIKSNTYSFPERLHISEQAKGLVRRILQSEPERRPTTDEILVDDFFQGEGAALVGAKPQHSIASLTSKALSSAVGILSNNGDNYRAPLKPISANEDSKKIYADTHKYSESTNKYTPSEYIRPSSAMLNTDRDVLSSAQSATTASLLERNMTTSTDPSARISSLLSRPISAVESTKTHTYKSTWEKRDAKGEDLTPTKQLAKAISNLELRRSPPKPTEKHAAVPSSATTTTTSARDDVILPSSVSNDGEDQQALYQMHCNIKQYVISSSNSTKIDPTSSTLPLPSVWVSRWVDYSKKYGLGYKLSNGCSGVFFNDATKMLLAADGDNMNYIERLRRDDGSKYDEGKPHRLNVYPTELTKKVTLMEHFKNYLDETHPNRDSPVHVPGKKAEGGSCKWSDAADGGVHEGVYVRKWMRTRHSIIFRLSNNNFQVNFFDDTEVLLWADRRWVTYKGKNKIRSTLELADISGVPELTKRIKYVTDILSQLVTRT